MRTPVLVVPDQAQGPGRGGCAGVVVPSASSRPWPQMLVGSDATAGTLTWTDHVYLAEPLPVGVEAADGRADAVQRSCQPAVAGEFI